ncbi:hypothetical protein EMCRGX_G011046 [Ephydatia muelleri]
MMLVKAVAGQKELWDKFLDSAVFAYNTSCHEFSYYTPYGVMLGDKATLPIDIDLNPVSPDKLLTSKPSEGAAAEEAEIRKHKINNQKCLELGDSEQVEDTKDAHGAIASEQDEKALSEHGDVVEIDQPLNVGDKSKVRDRKFPFSRNMKAVLKSGDWLSDEHMYLAQGIVQKQFSHIEGWQSTLLVQTVLQYDYTPIMSFSDAITFLAIFVFFSGHASKQVGDFDSIYPSNVSLSDTRSPLTIALMMSFSGDYVTYNSLSGVQLALDLINENSSLLPGYRLQYKLTDSQCNETTALTMLFGAYLSPRLPIVGLVGSGCEAATVPTAQISQFYGLTQVSSDSSAPELEDRNAYKMYFQMLPNEALLPSVFKALFDKFGWKKLYTIAEDNALFTVVMDGTKKVLPPGITSTVFSAIASSPNSLDNLILQGMLFNTDSRIIELAVYQPDALKAVCEAYHKKKYAPQYVLILRDWYGPQWWDPANAKGYNLSCTKEQMEMALNGAFAVALNAHNYDSNEITVSGLSLNQYYEEYTKRAAILGLDPNRDDPSYFDSFWAFALAINKTLQDLRSSQFFSNGTSNSFRNVAPPLFSTANNTASNDVIMEQLFQQMSNTSFTGITGDVSFNQHGIRRSYVIDIEQYRFDTENNELDIESIGYVLPNGTLILNDGENTSTIFPDGIPSDGSALNVTHSIEIGLTSVMYILAPIGIAGAIICFAFIVIFRHKRQGAAKIVQLSSPVLCSIVCMGCMMLYISVFFLAIQSKETSSATVICNLRVWLWGIGYSLAFGPILGKIFRIYFIFNYRHANNLNIKDWMIVMAVGILVGIDITLLIIASVVPQLRIYAEVQTGFEYPSIDSGFYHIPISNNILDCQSVPDQGYRIWQIILLSYKGFVQVLSIPLAFGARKVPIKGLNDSVYIISIVYITSVSLAVIIACFATLNNQGRVNTLAAVYSIGFWISATIILLLVFVPKMYYLYCDPNEDELASNEHSKKHHFSTLEEQAKKLEIELKQVQAQEQHLRTQSYSTPEHSCRDTYWVVSFNHQLLTCLPKRIYFHNKTFEMRINRSVMEWNENTQRLLQADDDDGLR